MNKVKVLQIVLVVVAVITVPIVYTKMLHKQTANTMHNIEMQVANDAVTQFEMVARTGDDMQMYAQAGMCAQAFLQAKDEANYRKWKDVENRLADKLGMPH